MKILGIETSCDETSAAVVEKGRNVLSCVTASQIKKHSEFGGVVPEIASREHIKKITEIVKSSLENANLKLKEINAIAVTNTPGLVGSLLVGINFAKGLSFSLKKPLIAVNHLKAHIAANYICHKNLKPPFLALIISGGHSNIVEVKNFCEFKGISKTMDDSIGEAFDKIGRALNLPYPAGAKIDELSKNVKEIKYSFPKPKVRKNPLNFSFSGVKTAVLNKLKEEKEKNNAIKIEDFAASFQKTVCDVVCEKVSTAIKFKKSKKLVVCGGVSANSKIREELKKLSQTLNFELFLPELKFCTDNAAMVASQAFFEFEDGNIQQNFNLNAKSCFSF